MRFVPSNVLVDLTYLIQIEWLKLRSFVKKCLIRTDEEQKHKIPIFYFSMSYYSIDSFQEP